MSLQVADFADLEKALCPALETWTGQRVVTDLPEDLVDHLPLHQIGKISGQQIAVDFDHVELNIDTYGPDRATAVAAAEHARNYMQHALVGALSPALTITRVRCDRTPTVVLYENPNLRRVVHVYGLWVKHVT